MGEIRIYTDERVDVAVAQGLQRRGVDAFSARDRDKLGFSDEEQLIFAGEEKATILPMVLIFYELPPNGLMRGGHTAGWFIVTKPRMKLEIVFGA